MYLNFRSQNQLSSEVPVCVDSLHLSQQFFSHAGTGLPGLNQYYAVDKMSRSRTQHSDFPGIREFIKCVKYYLFCLFVWFDA